MYTLFVQKKQGDGCPYPLTQQLHNFIAFTKADSLFISPGFLSTSASRIEELLDSFFDGIHIERVAIGNRCSANSMIYYEQWLDRHNMRWKVRRNNKRDHRKMMFILKTHQENHYEDMTFDYGHRRTEVLPDEIEEKNYQNILRQIDVIGVAIGSSNFSYTSYGIMNGTIIADKGEADILMFYDENYAQNLERILEDTPNREQTNMVLSQSITAVSNDYLKRMFAETLECILA